MLKMVCLVALAAAAFAQDCKSCNKDFGNAIFQPSLNPNGCLEGNVACFGCSERVQVVTNDGKVLYEGVRDAEDYLNYGRTATCNGNGKWTIEDKNTANLEFETVTCKDVGECIKG